LATKYIDLAVRPKKKQTRSALASGTGEPLEGLYKPKKKRGAEKETAGKN